MLPCAQPPHRTWEPDHHTPRSPEKPTIPTKNSPRPAKAPVSHVQHRRSSRPPGAPTTPRTEIGPLPARDRSSSARPIRRLGAHDELESEKGGSHMPHLRTISKQQTRGTGPISVRVTTDLDAECDRFRRGLRPVSSRNWTDLGGLRRLRRPRSSWDPQSARGGPTPAGSGPPRRVHRSRAR